ncbi:MAG TPA: type II toxin-antitoxin system HicB family antitoxin [Caulobacteraceae bacterium]|nr:type II toxin-antitoxin system HicB family antitoxin [Caulobacteraceae bacterium]
MTKLFYPAFLEQGEDGGWGVWFPDLPGCVSAGDTADEAVREAEDALALHLEALIEEGIELPIARGIEQMDMAEAAEAVGKVLIGAEEPDLSERVNVMLPRSLLGRIDRRASEKGLSRSAFLAMAARWALEAAQRGS